MTTKPEGPVQRQVDAYNARHQERIAGVGPEIIDALAVYEVIEDRIASIWFFSDK